MALILNGSDTSAGDDAGLGYTAAEGIIITGQGSTSDVTIKNDADATVLSIPTGTTNVGIGTTAAATKLHIIDSLSGGQLLVATSESDNAEKYGTFGTQHYDTDQEPVLAISAQSAASENNVLIGGALGEFNAATSVKFYTAANATTTGGSERMRIVSDGKVGIGTTAPTRTLTVIGSVGNQFVSSQSQSNDTAKYGTYAGSHYHNAEQDVAGVVVLSNGTDNTVYLGGGVGELNAATVLAFHTGANDATTGGSERMRITSDGRLLAGTTTSYGRLHSANISFNPGNAAWLTGASFVSSGSFGGGYALLDGSAGYSMYCAESGSDFFIQHHSSTTAGSTGGVKLDNAATSWTSASDEREKENLVGITDATTKIKSLRTVIGNYTWQPDVKHAFLIAQDVQTVLPEAVSVVNKSATTDDQRLGIRYTEVIPLLTAALKESLEKIEALETRITALEAG